MFEEREHHYCELDSRFVIREVWRVCSACEGEGVVPESVCGSREQMRRCYACKDAEWSRVKIARFVTGLGILGEHLSKLSRCGISAEEAARNLRVAFGAR